MKKYFPFFLPYKKALILAPLLVIIDVICEIVQPDLMSKIPQVPSITAPNRSYKKAWTSS